LQDGQIAGLQAAARFARDLTELLQSANVLEEGVGEA
jgi:hypothetical protein